MTKINQNRLRTIYKSYVIQTHQDQPQTTKFNKFSKKAKIIRFDEKLTQMTKTSKSDEKQSKIGEIIKSYEKRPEMIKMMKSVKNYQLLKTLK